MSRIIVKNLPKKITREKLHELFATKGCVTDLQLKYTKDGVFRQFAFVGYKTEEEAQSAKEYFHNTYVNASKIQVEACADLGDEKKPKAWSKHCKVLKLEKEEKKKEKEPEAKANIGAVDYPKELQNDKLFAEFLELNKDRKSKPVWIDDVTDFAQAEKEAIKEQDSEDDGHQTSGSSDSELSEEQVTGRKIVASTNESGEKKKEEHKKTAKVLDDSCTVKLRNLPFRCKKKQIKQFFHPLKIISLRIPPKFKGFAYVKFKSEGDMKRALNKNKGFLDGHRVHVVKYEKKDQQPEVTNSQDAIKEETKSSSETLAETGRLFVRNLCYGVTENELEELFSKYGPIAEIHLPIDSYTKKGQGFAFVTYVFSEHAVKAFTKLDGTTFQGRLLHVIPGRPKIEATQDISELPFKKRKDAKLKALSGSSHNWNTLFLGLNAVADAVSHKYNISKNELLNNESSESIAVRMALGETQLVLETREFLVQNGVQLDAFSQAAAERSKNVIIAKNLPANTPSSEIYNVFSKYGVVSRVIIPPAGITALIEFQQASEAKTAFKKLAYSRFHHLPLYLEWAPMNVFKDSGSQKTDASEDSKQDLSHETKVEASAEDSVVKEEMADVEPEPGTTLFVKNINFNTTEDILKKHFKKCGPVHCVSISKKKDIHTGKLLSMGFGFVQFKHKSSAVQALQDLQNSELDEHKLELKFSNRATIVKAEVERKKAQIQEQKTCKILVRNIAFEVTEKEIRDLFKEFGNLKSVRLPKRMDGQGRHRGFGFVEFSSKANAKRAFDTLCHSTHLLGRRLVLEWANPTADDVSELRKKTARNFSSDGPSRKVKKSKLKEDAMLASAKQSEDFDSVF